MNIKDFTPRLYQETILDTAKKYNTLVVLPTGLGKTNVSMLLAANRLTNFPNSKILLLAPTKPLANQHLITFQKNLDISSEKLALFTGSVSPEKRKELWINASCIFSTPQTISNDIINNRVNLEEVSAIIFDECHRAIGNYDYVWIAKQYQKNSRFPRILALTASPGSNLETISEICKNLYIENIEVRTEEDPDVKPYIQISNIEWIKLDLPEQFKEISKFLHDCLKSKLEKLKNLGLINSFSQKSIPKTELLNLQREIHGKLSRGEKDISLWQGISLTAESIKVQHAVELLETQSPQILNVYMKNIYEESEKTKVKAIKNLANDLNFKSAYIQLGHLLETNVSSPKLIKLKEIIQQNKEKRIIIFNQYRDSASLLESELNKIENIKAKLFVGQLKKGLTGLTQKEQIAIIDDFKKGVYNILISTSVGEEGLDIPAVDLVIFFEPVPSAIRAIQRRGRTGRLQEGKIIILMVKNTRDEISHWVAHHKEKRMNILLKNLKNKLEINSTQPKLQNFINKETPLKIFADSREKGNNVIKELVNLGINITSQNLEVADYIISEEVGIELKTKEDFINSIIDKRLLNQLKELKRNFIKPLIIIQGDQDIFSIRNIHPNAIRGMLATIAISYGIPIIETKNDKETAALIHTIAKREQSNEEKSFGVNQEKKPLTSKEQQEFIVESLPGVGPSLAKSLLKEFKSIKNIINSDEDSLQKIEKMGPKKSKEIKRILEEIYPD